MRLSRGFILLPVVVAFTLLAAVAFLLNRDAGMSVTMAARGFETDTVRYVAEAGLARMHNRVQNANCTGYAPLNNVAFGAGTFSASATPSAGTPVALQATGTTASGAVASLTRINVTVRKTTPYVLTLQPGPAGADTFITSGSAATNYGSDTGLKMQAGRDQPLIRFDLSTIPANSAIQSAVLSLYASGAGSAVAGDTVSAMRVTRAWTEGTQAGGGTADGATWANADSSTPWTAAGGDYDLIAAAVTPYNAVVGWKSWDIAALVDAWVNGNYPNYGVELVPSAGIFNAVFVSGDDPVNFTWWPKLAVTFLPPCDWTPVTTVTLASAADSNLNGASPTWNYGASTSIWIYDSGNRRGVFRFNTATIAAGTLLTSAKLRLYVTGMSARSGGTMRLKVHELTRAWTESAVTWNRRIAGIDWSSPGGDYQGSDAARLDLPASFNSGWIEFDIKALAQAWVDGAITNNGVIVRGNDPDRFYVASKEAGASTAPQLVISY